MLAAGCISRRWGSIPSPFYRAFLRSGKLILQRAHTILLNLACPLPSNWQKHFALESSPLLPVKEQNLNPSTYHKMSSSLPERSALGKASPLQAVTFSCTNHIRSRSACMFFAQRKMGTEECIKGTGKAAYPYYFAHRSRLSFSYIPSFIIIAILIYQKVFAVEDAKQNNGTPDKPYYMSTELQRILGKQNQFNTQCK